MLLKGGKGRQKRESIQGTTALESMTRLRYELVWLFYNGLTYGEEKLKPLIERYAMLSNLRTDMLANCSEIDEGAYCPSAYTKTIVRFE